MKETPPRLTAAELASLRLIVESTTPVSSIPESHTLLPNKLVAWQDLQEEEKSSGNPWQVRLHGMPKARRLVLTPLGLRALLSREKRAFEKAQKKREEEHHLFIAKARGETFPAPRGDWNPSCDHQRDGTFTCIRCKTCCEAEQRGMDGGCINCGAPCW